MALDKQGNFSQQPSELPDVPSPNMTPDQIRAKWQTPLDELKTTVNNAFDKLNATTKSASGADNIGATDWDGVTASTVGALLSWLKANKTDLTGNHEGTWQGFNPSQVDQTIRDQVNTNTSQLADIAYDPKQYGALFDGVTDDTTALRNTIAKCKSENKSLYVPNGTAIVSGTLDVSGIKVFGNGEGSKLKATSNQFDILTTTGNTILDNFYIDGSWDGSTAGQSGNSVSVVNPSGFAYNVHVVRMKIQNSKKDGIYIEKGGYSSILSTKINACGLHGIELNGIDANNAITTIDIDGFTTSSDCPNGYGVRINEGMNITLKSLVCEYTKGVEIAGTDNRNIDIMGMYQENTSTNNFVTLTGSGQRLNIIGCFGGNSSISYNQNFYGVNIFGNALLNLPTDAFNWNMVQDGDSSTTFSTLKTILGIQGNNKSGTSPAHKLDTAPITGFNNYILQLLNNGNERFHVDATGGIFIANGVFDGGHITLGTYHLWIDTNGVLRIKNGTPTSATDGVSVGSQT